MEPTWQNLSDPIFHYAETRPDAPAVIDGGLTLSYRGFASLVAKATVYLRDLGLGQGDRIAVALTNSAEHIILNFALLRIGATLVEMSVDDTGDALAATAQKYGIRVIFTEAGAGPCAGMTQFRVGVSWRRDLERKNGDIRTAATAAQLDTILLTTGSTGTPTGWVTTQRAFFNRVAALHAFWRECGIDPTQKTGNFLVTAPLRYVYFFVSLLAQVAAGGPLVVLPEFSKRRDVLRTVASWDDAICYVTANMCRFFLESAPDAGCLLPNIRLLQSGGLPLFAEEKRALLVRVTPHFYDGYGTAGMGMISIVTPTEIVTRPGSVGRPASGVELEVVGANDAPLPAGSYGKIRCRSASMSSYRCTEDAYIESAEHIADGWYYPGDIGMIDGEGFLHLKGRSSDVVRRGDTDVFAPEIEAAFMSHPNVAEVAVVGRPGTAGGDDKIIAFVVKRGDLQHEALARHCRMKLTPSRIPDNVYYIDTLPRLGNGKVDRMHLLDLAAREAAKSAAG